MQPPQLRPSTLAAFTLLLISTSCATSSRTGSNIAYPGVTVSSGELPSARTLLATARVKSDEGAYSEARQALCWLLAEDPGNVEAYRELGQILLREGRVVDARQVLHAGLVVSPQDVVLMNELGTCDLLEGDAQGALRWYRRAMSVSPSDMRTRENLALVLSRLGDDDQAREVLEERLPGEVAGAHVARLRAEGPAATRMQRPERVVAQAPAFGGHAPSVEVEVRPEPVREVPTTRVAPVASSSSWHGADENSHRVSGPVAVPRQPGVVVREVLAGRVRVRVDHLAPQAVWVLGVNYDYRLEPGAIALFGPDGRAVLTSGEVREVPVSAERGSLELRFNP